MCTKNLQCFCQSRPFANPPNFLNYMCLKVPAFRFSAKRCRFFVHLICSKNHTHFRAISLQINWWSWWRQNMLLHKIYDISVPQKLQRMSFLDSIPDWTQSHPWYDHKKGSNLMFFETCAKTKQTTQQSTKQTNKQTSKQNKARQDGQQHSPQIRRRE